MTFANYNANQLWLQLVKNQQKINLLVVAVLAIFLLAYAAELTWRLWPMPVNTETTHATRQPTRVVSGNSQTNLADIKRLNLFGDLTAQPIEIKETVTDAPVTRLSLTLTGVVASTNEDEGAAIIENRGQQQTYGIGEKIEGTNASLKEVYADRVIIKNGPQHETLMLDGVDYTKANSQKEANQKPRLINTPQVTDQRRTLSDDAIEATRELQQQPANFTDYIAVSPQRKDGELTGYRVSPGKKPSLFKAVGLVSGDIITELNGLDLTDMQQSLEAMNMLKELQSLQMTVLREEELITIYLDLPEGEEEF
ncbi:type II secretion system protein GspC [Paraglaciecola aquimarina]|uniref:Type II secretion system protein GspC n=1 Tax=Paraglaciecola aquimarina TaxID=1235557 RepID=A0ABU3STB4_9ALTE|nr:type II secretion system protein GspC [Paraglaciecola aquimarina]MDU0353223.1 type II secretion system protein GspC [Paraglaciecola aquimarina]